MTFSTLNRISKSFAAFCGIYLLAYLFIYIRGNLFYFGEAISYEGLLRMVHGMKFASSPEEIPLSLTPYTPLFLLPLIGLGKAFSITQIETISVVARLFQLGLLVTLLGLINSLRKRFVSDLSSGWAFLWVLIPVFFYSPPMELGLRPDTLSFLCEAGSVFAMLTFLRQQKNHSLILAALLAGLAISIKLNTLGAAVAISCFCLFFLDIKRFSIFTSIAATVVFVALGLQYLFLGETLPQNILSSIQSTLLSGSDALRVYMKLLDLFLFPFSYYLFLVVYGLSKFPTKKEKALFNLVLSFSFIFALVGQIKWGAFHNYFLGFIYLGLIPASIGFHQLVTTADGSKKTALLLFHFLYITLFMARGSSIPFKILQDSAYLSELNQLRALVEEKAPKGYLYTQDEQLQLAFAHRTAIGVLSQELLQVTPKLQKHITNIQEKLRGFPPFSGYIFRCEDYDRDKVAGMFLIFDDVKRRTKVKTGKYCFFY